MKVRLLPLLLLLALVLLPQGALAKTPLKVGYLPILDHLALAVSHEMDNQSFSEVEIRPQMFKRWDNMVGAFRAGVIDAAFILAPLAMEMFDSGDDIRCVLIAHRNGAAITVRKNSGISSAGDLKNRTVAIPHGKATHVALLDGYLRTVGLSLKEVKTPMIDPANMQKALELGKIDGFTVSEPFNAKAEREGVGKVLVLSRDMLKDHIDCIVIVRASFLAKNRAAVQEWVNSLVRAGKFIETDKSGNKAGKSAAIAARYMGHREGDVVEGLTSPMERITFADLEPRIPDFERIVEISRKAGILEGARLDLFIDDGFYKNAKMAGTAR